MFVIAILFELRQKFITSSSNLSVRKTSLVSVALYDEIPWPSSLNSFKLKGSDDTSNLKFDCSLSYLVR